MEQESNYDAELAVFKKKLKQLKGYKGRHTELITLYVPNGTDRGTVMNQLSEEINQSSNIKSPTTRKNVQGALRKIIVFLKKINFNIPPHGIVIFSGNVSTTEGKSDIKLFTVQPLKDLNTKLYWCDSEFHLDPLNEMVVPDEFYALMVLDKNEVTIAQLSGKKYDILGHFTSTVPGKTRAGGQCLIPETNLILSTGEITTIEKIKENDYVKSIDFKTGTTIDSKITKKWQTMKSTITIKTKSPQFEISSSPDHKFFVWKNGVIIEKLASELTEQDVLLFNETIKINTQEIKLTNNLYNRYSLTKAGQAILVQTRQNKNLFQKELANKINLSQTEISLLELGKRNPQRKTINSVCKELNLDPDNFTKKHCEPLDPQTLPSKLDCKLAQFLGYFEGDGSFEKERISLAESDKMLANFYANLAKQLFNTNITIKHRKNKGYFQTRIYGKQIVNFIKANFPEITSALDSEIPKKISFSDNKILAAFIKGFYDAEGYVSNKSAGLGINNKKLAQQIQLSLLRFGIISSLSEYDNKQNKYSNNPRYTIIISGKYSLELFKSKINFNSKQKTKKLNETILKKSTKDKSRQLLTEGHHIKSLLLDNNNPLKEFYNSNMFLNGKRKISKEVFITQILKKANKQAQTELKQILEYELLPTEVSTIIKTDAQPMFDISTESQNFIANGLIVHNSSQRFERLREEAMQDFFKRIGEKFNGYFVENTQKIKGIIIGGPGMTKQYFIDKQAINHELNKKVIGVVDTSYTDEGGIRELVQKSEVLLKDTEMMREKVTLDNFLGEVAKDGLATYGHKEVETAMDEGRVKTLIISEELDWIVVKKLCGHCDKEEIEIFMKPSEFVESKVRCSECSSKVEITEEVDYLDYMLEKANDTGANVNVVGNESAEGKNFLEGFGGVGAILRYKI